MNVTLLLQAREGWFSHLYFDRLEKSQKPFRCAVLRTDSWTNQWSVMCQSVWVKACNLGCDGVSRDSPATRTARAVILSHCTGHGSTGRVMAMLIVILNNIQQCLHCIR